MTLAHFVLHSTYVAEAPEIIGEVHGKPIESCIAKRPVALAHVQITDTGLTLDCQQDLEVHGGPEKAFYAWPIRNYDAWALANPNADLLADMSPDDPYQGGHFGENLLVAGDYPREENVRVGDTWAWGDCLLEVTQPREPCFKLTAYIPGAPKWMIQTGMCGWYLKLASQAGTVPAYGAPLQLLARGSGPTITEAFRAKMRRNKGRVHGPR